MHRVIPDLSIEDMRAKSPLRPHIVEEVLEM